MDADRRRLAARGQQDRRNTFGLCPGSEVLRDRGQVPRGGDEIPAAAVVYLAEKVTVDPGEFAAYRWTGRTIEYHRAQIRDAFGFREFTRADEEKLADWMANEVCPVELRDEQLREALLVRCRAERLEPPGRIERIIGSARTAFDQRFRDRTVTRLGEHCTERLDDLADRQLLAELKADPGQGRTGDPVARNRQVERDPRPAPAAGSVRGRVGEAGRGLAGSRRPVL
ncbi:DUF4158 domain-containing protein [Nocardia sp. NBC_00881]|uniref:DUF4158 domain-containing protein n=1 Tax=Nocardia sp. NBC_00881 TaxID=2975995 RepID=UPI0038648834|nr:DUF4158 domain-containing protein [Nocardia sp. NBC_00881]